MGYSWGVGIGMQEEERTYTLHLENGDRLLHLNRADTVRAMIENPSAKLEVYESTLESVQEVADMERVGLSLALPVQTTTTTTTTREKKEDAYL